MRRFKKRRAASPSIALNWLTGWSIWAILALLLVACGGETATVTPGPTTSPVSSTTSAATSAATPTTSAATSAATSPATATAIATTVPVFTPTPVALNSEALKAEVRPLLATLWQTYKQRY